MGGLTGAAGGVEGSSLAVTAATDTALAPGLPCGPETLVCLGMTGAWGQGPSPQAELFRGEAEGCPG